MNATHTNFLGVIESDYSPNKIERIDGTVVSFNSGIGYVVDDSGTRHEVYAAQITIPSNNKTLNVGERVYMTMLVDKEAGRIVRKNVLCYDALDSRKQLRAQELADWEKLSETEKAAAHQNLRKNLVKDFRF